MKHPCALLIALTIFAASMLCCAAMAEAAGEEVPEWTVMIYFCGSDLESRNGYATGNLEGRLRGGQHFI